MGEQGVWAGEGAGAHAAVLTQDRRGQKFVDLKKIV